MVRDDQSSLSEMESEYELEMDDRESDYESDTEFELNEFEYEGTGDYEDELSEEFEGTGDYEDELEGEFEFESDDGEASQYGDRFYELAQMEFESESELDQEVNGILNEMEQDFFWKAAKRFIKRRGPGILGKLGKVALSKSPFGQAFKGFSQLAKGNLKGALAGLAKTALSAHPAMAAAMPALNALGFEASEDSGANREAWGNYAEVAREAYENLAANMNPKASNPRVASVMATRALQSALSKAGSRNSGRSYRPGGRRPRGKRRVVRLAPGEYLVVLRGGR